MHPENSSSYTIVTENSRRQINVPCISQSWVEATYILPISIPDQNEQPLTKQNKTWTQEAKNKPKLNF